MFNREKLQRFSIRKLTVGTASVLIGVLFLTSWNTNKVYADSGNVTSGESIAKNNNPQEGNPAVNKDNVQIVDNGSTNGSTEVNESSDSNRSNVIKSDATNRDNVRDKTTINDNSRTTEPTGQANNKKVVSDANRAKSTANDAQTKSAQQTAKSDAANSNTLVVQQTKKLTGNVKLNALTDNKAQTDTQTNSKYSVTDNYPADLTNYLPSTFNNKQEYAFEWLQNENKNNIILTTNRTGDGEVYVYLDGKKVGTLATNSSYPLPLYDNIWGDEIGTVYNDDYAGIVQSNNGYLLNIIYSSHAKDVDNAGSSYSTVSFFVPHKIKQTVTYKDSKGNVIDRLTHTQYGLTGQSYTTGLPSGSDYVRAHDHEYLDNITNNNSGLISEFYNGYSCTKDYHDGVKVTFTENDSDGIGAMDYVVKDNGKEVKSGILKYGNSAEYDKYAWNGWHWYKSRSYTIVNPYVPQTTDIVYQYKKLGQVITTDPSGKNTKKVYYTVYYTNDQSDPIKIEPVNAEPITGYSAIVKYENKIVSDKNFKPTNLGENTYITYSANDQKAGIKYIDDVTKETLSTDTDNGKGKFGQPITFRTDPANTIKYYEDQGYKLESNNFKTTDTYQADNNKNQFEVHFIHGTTDVTPDKPKTPSDIIPGTAKHYPSGVDKDNLNKTVTRTINVISPDGKTTTIKQPVTLQRSATVDDVTGQITYKAWNTGKWEEYDTPQISGYTPSQAKVSATTVDGNTQDQTVTITYSADDQSTTAKFVDDDNNGAQVGKTITLSGKTDQTINTGLQVPANYELAKGQTLPATYTFKAENNSPIVIHLVHATKPDTNDNHLNKTVTRTINVTNPDGKTTTIKQEAHLHRSGTIDEVTQTATYTPWTTDNWAEYDTPQISGYTPSQAKVSATTVDGNTQDQTVTITYRADDQKASVTYVDDKTGKTLKVDNLNGVTNAKSGYTTKAAIDTYTGLGYTLVSDDTNGKEVVFDNDDAVDQAFTVHLSHGTITVTPENPGKPGEPVDPDNPDGPKYPDGTEEYQVKRTGTQTIHYVGAGDKTPADNKQTFVFTREITFDDVTGKIISVTPWNVQSHTFGNVDTPVIPGYHADKAVAGGETVTPDDLNKVITVTYAPDGGSGDNPGSNGGGDQGTTPTPDDQPDTTLPSDNNTDKDVEKDKQDKPKKVKKARKIIKTRITKQEHIGNAEKAEPLAEQEHNDQTVASPVKNDANEPQLPQTGEANTSVIGLLGMLVAGFAEILGFESSRSRKHKNQILITSKNIWEETRFLARI